jgi:predicted DNA-binding transcriptional regulator AlpA
MFTDTSNAAAPTAPRANLGAARGLPPIVTSRQLAALFQVCTKTIHIWARARKLPPPLPTGRSRRWELAKVLVWVGASEGISHAS